MRETNEELERLIRTLSTGIERKSTVERISTEDIRQDGKIIEILKDSSLDATTGGINEQIVFKVKTLSCGCAIQGRRELGGICQKCGNIVCKRHFYRCIRCQKGICCRCISAIDGIVYCKKCGRITKLLRFLKLKK
jgi:hypothetical protein